MASSHPSPWSRRLAALFLVIGIVLSPLHATAATVPVPAASMVAVGLGATTQAGSTGPLRPWAEEARSTVYDEELVGHRPTVNPSLIEAPAFVVAGSYGYDDRTNFGDRRAVRPERATVSASAAEGIEAAATRRLSTVGDTQFRTAEEALAEAVERHGIDPSTVETTTMYGKNPNLLGPKGQPWDGQGAQLGRGADRV